MLNGDNEWFYTYYTQLIFENEHVNFLVYTYDKCLLIDCEMYYWAQKIIDNNLVNLLMRQLDKGFCAIIELNQKYIPGRMAYDKYDFQHSNMIFGYDKENMLFNIIGMNSNRVFKDSKVSFDEIINAFKNIDDYKLPIRFVRRKKDVVYRTDWNKIYYDLDAYINNGINEVNYRNNCHFGQEASICVKQLIYRMINNVEHKDARQISTIRDHKHMMLNKVRYFRNIGIEFSANVVEEFEAIKKLADLCVRLFLKFELTDNVNCINEIFETIDVILEKEKNIYPIVAEGIR